MTEIEISAAACEGYLAAVADTLADAGYQLPALPAAPYVFDPDEVQGGAVTLPTALPDSDALRLIWREDAGWLAGYPREDGGTDCLTELWLDAVPPPWRVVRAVQAIAKTGDLSAGITEDRADWPIGLLPLYEPDAAGLVQAAADEMRARAARISGRRPEPAEPDGTIAEHVRPIVAAVWNKVRPRVDEQRAALDQFRAAMREEARPNRAELRLVVDAAATVEEKRPLWVAESPALRTLLTSIPQLAECLRTQDALLDNDPNMVRLAAMARSAIREHDRLAEELDAVTAERDDLAKRLTEPRIRALEEVGERYPEARDWHIANESARATRTAAGQGQTERHAELMARALDEIESIGERPARDGGDQ